MNDRERIIGELETLRRYSPVTETALKEHAPLVVKLLGSYKPAAALERLQTLEVKDANVRFVDAALVALGFGPYKGNITERWSDFLAARYPDKTEPRTARRWCDIGFGLIADAMLGEPAVPSIAVLVKDGTDKNSVTFGFTVDGYRWESDDYIDLSYRGLKDSKWATVVDEIALKNNLADIDTPELAVPATAELRFPEHVRPFVYISAMTAREVTIVQSSEFVEVAVSP